MQFKSGFQLKKLFFVIVFFIILGSSFISLFIYFKYEDIHSFKIDSLENQNSLQDKYLSYFISAKNDKKTEALNKTAALFEHNILSMLEGGNILYESNKIESKYFSPVTNVEIINLLVSIDAKWKDLKNFLVLENLNSLNYAWILVEKNDALRKDYDAITAIYKNLFEQNFLYMLLLQTFLSICGIFLVYFIFNNYNKLASAEKKIIYYLEREKLAEHYQKIRKNEINELQRSNKDLESFAYIASHDLKEPLRMVTSYAELLREKYIDKLDDKADKYIKYIVDGANIMLLLMEDLLSYSCVKTHEYKFERINLSKIISSVKSNLEMMIKESEAKIRFGVLPEVLGDRIQFIELFQNLICNAIKYRRVDVKPIIEINVTENLDNYIFSIKDNGIGIDSKFFERIFIIFQRLHKKHVYSGNGIGLAIAKSIVDKHDGKIWVESEINKGSTFFFTIPINRSLT